MKAKGFVALKKYSVIALCAIMVMNTNVWSINYISIALFGGQAMASESESDDKVLNKLRQKHNLADPYRHNRGQKQYEIIERPTRDLTSQLEQSIISGRTRDSHLDFSDLPTLSISDGLDSARVVASTATGPSLTEGHEIEMQVASEPVLEMYRDEETGALRYRQIENIGAVQRKNVRVGQTEIFSTEIEHEHSAWEGGDVYGDEQALYQAGRDSNQRLSSSSVHTGESEAYKTIMASADRGANETVPDEILQPGFDYINDMLGPGGDFFNDCTTVTQTENAGLYKPDIQQRYCQEMNSANPFFCEVSREFRIPVIHR